MIFSNCDRRCDTRTLGLEDLVLVLGGDFEDASCWVWLLIQGLSEQGRFVTGKDDGVGKKWGMGRDGREREGPGGCPGGNVTLASLLVICVLVTGDCLFLKVRE